MSADDVARYAYDSFRGGFRGTEQCPVPHWDDAPTWVRDVVKVAVLAGGLRPPLQFALEAILAEPHGCAFCDSGKLRNPNKDHNPTCGFAMARAALTAGRRHTEARKLRTEN